MIVAVVVGTDRARLCCWSKLRPRWHSRQCGHRLSTCCFFGGLQRGLRSPRDKANNTETACHRGATLLAGFSSHATHRWYFQLIITDHQCFIFLLLILLISHEWFAFQYNTHAHIFWYEFLTNSDDDDDTRREGHTTNNRIILGASDPWRCQLEAAIVCWTEQH